MECVNISAGHSPKAPLRARVSCLLGSVCCVLCPVSAGAGALSLSVTLATHVCLVSSLRRSGAAPPPELQNSHWASSATLLASFFVPYSEVCCYVIGYLTGTLNTSVFLCCFLLCVGADGQRVPGEVIESERESIRRMGEKRGGRELFGL